MHFRARLHLSPYINLAKGGLGLFYINQNCEGHIWRTKIQRYHKTNISKQQVALGGYVLVSLTPVSKVQVVPGNVMFYYIYSGIRGMKT